MNTSTKSTARTALNVPNQLTIARLVLAVVLFVVLSFELHLIGLVVFVVAALTDLADGFWARRYGQVTQLGRIMDPFADKIVICGTFVFLVADPRSLVAPWMAVVIIGREMLVTVLRSFIEEQGGDFSAKWAGKWKMALQCLAVVLCLWRLNELGPATIGNASEPAKWLTNATIISVWAALVLTVYSGVEYVAAALRMLRR